VTTLQKTLLGMLNLISTKGQWCTSCGYPKYKGVVFPKWKEGDPPVKGEHKWLCPFGHEPGHAGKRRDQLAI
jgi:hypothetical protein